MTPDNPCGCEGTINESDPRSEIWTYVFGKRSFPIKWPFYSSNPQFPGKRFLTGDEKTLSVDQLARLVDKMAEKFHISCAQVNVSSGVPILDEGITITFCKRHSVMAGGA